MCPMLLSSLRDGPTMILSPSQDHAFLPFPRQPMLDASPAPNSRPLFTNGVHSHASSSGVKSFGASPSTSLATSSKPSRKRSRDDVAAEDAPIERVPTVPVPARAPQEEPIYGEGMTLINSRTGMAPSAESQTGTWYEEAIESAYAAATPVSSRLHAPCQASRKSQRLAPSASGLDDITMSRIQRQLQENDSDDNRRVLNASSSRSNPFSLGEPQVDDATRLLGISWQCVQPNNDADMAAAVRGWKKYIDRQFSRYLVDSEILMKNRALNAYLVTARPMTFMGPSQASAFYLFNDDLTQAQLVALSLEACLRNLQSSPIMFEGIEVLTASDKLPNLACLQNQNGLATNPADTGLPLLQTLCAQPIGTSTGLNGGMGLGTGMDIDL